MGGGKDQVKAAFLNLAKLFHPDRLPQSLAHYHDKVTNLFEAIRAAYETLYDDARRAAYMSEIQRSATAATAAAVPRSGGYTGDELMKMGEVYLQEARVREGRRAASARPTRWRRAPPRSPRRPGPSTWTPRARPRPPTPRS